MSGDTYRLVKSKTGLEVDQRKVTVKGKGEMTTYLVNALVKPGHDLTVRYEFSQPDGSTDAQLRSETVPRHICAPAPALHQRVVRSISLNKDQERAESRF